jgi:hypothetical protein
MTQLRMTQLRVPFQAFQAQIQRTLPRPRRAGATKLCLAYTCCAYQLTLFEMTLFEMLFTSIFLTLCSTF